MHCSKSRSGKSALNLLTNSSSCTHSNLLSTVSSYNTRTKRMPTASHTWECTIGPYQTFVQKTHLSKTTSAPNAGHRNGKVPNPANIHTIEPSCPT